MDVEKPDEPSEVPPAPAAKVQDPCLDAARHLHSLGVPTLSVDLSVNSMGVKTPRGLPSRWGACRLDNCLEEYVKPRHNSLAMITGSASDVYAVDVDLKDNGAAAFQEMLEENGCLPSDTPTERMGSGGMHLLFSLRASLDAGLISGGSRNKLKWRGRGDTGSEGPKKVGIDTRGDGGMLYCAPSSYVAADGTRLAYTWLEEIEPDRSNLRSMPQWLISFINGKGAAAT
jgi:hypothetical protein